MAGPENEEQFRNNVELQQEIGLDVDFVDPEELDDYVPALDAREVAVAAIEREAGFADPYLVATGFAEQAQTLGAKIHTNTPITDIETCGTEVVAVESGADRYETDLVVNAAGPWAAPVAEMAGVDLPLSRYEAKIVSLTSSTAYPPTYPTVSDIDLGLVAKPEASGDFIAGGIEREHGHESISGREELEGVTNENLEYPGEALEHRLSGYADAEVVDSWSELITAPPDWHQIIGSPPSVDNFYVVAGGSGHGFKEAPGFAESIAQDILGREPLIDLGRYRPKRFETGDVFTGGYGDGTRS
jgi:sarcosine oxidase subunit beta